MRSKRLPGLPVLSIANGSQLGRVRRPIIDCAERKVVGFIISGSRLGARKILPMESIHALGSHAVTVTQAESLKSLKDEGVATLLGKPQVSIVGSPVVTIQGVMVGTVQDYKIGEGGIIDQLYLSRNLWKTLSGNEIPVPGEMVVAFGEDAVIVTDEVEKFASAMQAPQTKTPKKVQKPVFSFFKPKPTSSPPSSKPE